MNGLIAAPEGGPALSQAYESLKIIGPASGVLHAAGEGGGWAVAEGLAGGIGVVADVAEFLLDPIASLAGSVAGFLLDYMPPLPQMLDSIAGSPQAVEAKAHTWENVAGRLTSCAAGYTAAVDRALEGWSGPAASAYRSYASVFRTGLDTMSTTCAGVGAVMQGASAVVGFVRSIVRDVIADLVGKLISWASQVAATVGVGATWVVPQAVTAIAIRVERVRDWIVRLTRGIRSLAQMIETANQSLVEAVPALRRLATVLDDVATAPVKGVEAVTLREVLVSATAISNTLDRVYEAAATASGREG